MNLEQLIHAGVLCADLSAIDVNLTSISIGDLNGIIQLKSALVALANVADFEATLKPTYRANSEPSELIRPLRKNLAFAKYIRNKLVGHIHPDLIAKTIEWQPKLTSIAKNIGDPKAALIVNLWLLETTINTYVAADGSHKVFDSETDVMYPPDWHRFLDFLETTIRGSLAYLRLLNKLWSPILSDSPSENTLELFFEAAGQTDFKFLGK